MKKGFTLVELVVVIAIIGILTAVMLASFSQAKSRSRDVKRISDVSQMQLALAGYFDRCGAFPATTTIGTGESSCTSSGTTIKLSTFVSSMPLPPYWSTGEAYVYTPDAGFDDYFIHASLENSNSSSNNSMTSLPAWYSGSITCNLPKDYCMGSK